MRYWMTTHWPSRPPRKHRHIFLPDSRQEPGKRVKVGDQVMIYESKIGRSEYVLEESGERLVKGRTDGARGIVTIGEVLSPVIESGLPPSKYAGGTEIWWRWKAETGRHNDSGFVSRAEVCEVLQYSPNYSFRGFGEKNSGLKELTPDQFTELSDRFRAVRKRSRHFEPPSHVPSKYGPGGEGAAHKSLKEFVAANPGAIFDEDGLEHVGTEVLMPSGDRIDVLLRDRIGRYVAVEIEVTQAAGQLDGFCQAVKYRYLACVLYEVDFEASRSALVAYEIDATLDPIAHRYAVELIRVDPQTVSP